MGRVRGSKISWCSFGEIKIRLTLKMSNILYINDGKMLQPFDLHVFLMLYAYSSHSWTQVQ